MFPSKADAKEDYSGGGSFWGTEEENILFRSGGVFKPEIIKTQQETETSFFWRRKSFASILSKSSQEQFM